MTSKNNSTLFSMLTEVHAVLGAVELLGKFIDRTTMVPFRLKGDECVSLLCRIL